MYFTKYGTESVENNFSIFPYFIGWRNSFHETKILSIVRIHMGVRAFHQDYIRSQTLIWDNTVYIDTSCK